MKQPSIGANLSDVAARAGVSVASASRVLSGSKYLDPIAYAAKTV